MSELAYESDKVDLTEAERAGARHDAAVCEQPSVSELMKCIKRSGKVDGIVEAALGLPVEQYERVRDAWKRAPAPDLPKTRRRS